MFLSRLQRIACCCRSKYFTSYDFQINSKFVGLALHTKLSVRARGFSMTRQQIFPSSSICTFSHPLLQSPSHSITKKELCRNYSVSPSPKNKPDQITKQTDQSKDTDIESRETEERQALTEEREGEEEDQPKGILARFKDAYKNYGKALVGVHIVTSTVWFGSFYYAAYSGLDIIPLLKWIGFSDRIISPFESSGVGNIAVAYLLYKIATPARYTVTIVGTQYTVRYLRHLGYMPPVPEGSRIRDLVKESREQVKGKYEDFKEDIKDKKVEYKEKYEDKIEEYKGRLEETKDKVKDKKVEYKEKYEDKIEEYKGRLEETKDKVKDKLKQ